MKTFSIVLVLCLAIFSCGSSDKKGDRQGGWQKQDINADSVKKGYEFLQKEMAISHPDVNLKSVEEAQTQVVQGYKLKLKCKYQKKSEPEKSLNALIYVDLQKAHTLEELKL